MTTLFAFLHHLAAFTLVASVAIEFVLLRTAFSVSVARRLRLVDAAFGISAALLLLVGACRVFYFEKGSDYYLSSPYFLLKLALFVAVGIMSIVPTRAFLSWAPALKASSLPPVSERQLATLRTIINLELAALAVILLCAAAAARGGIV